MGLNSQLIDAFAYKGFSLDIMRNENCVIATGPMSGVNIDIHFSDETDAKTWFENTFNYSIIDAAELLNCD